MRRKLNRRGKTVLFLTALFLGILFLYGIYYPVLKLTAETEAALLAERAVAEAVAEAMESYDLSSLITAEKGDDGGLTAVSADSAALNRWKTELVRKAEEKLENQVLIKKIPLGTLLNSTAFYGRGPRVPLRVTLGGSFSADTETVFEGAGVNQTRYGVYLRVKIKLNTYLPLCHAWTEAESSMLLGEYIIVGEVPNLYANPVK